MAPFLKPVGATGEEVRSAAVSVLTVHGDGRRPDSCRIRAVNGDSSLPLRSATVLFCRLWNEPQWLFSGIEGRLSELRGALDTLATNDRRGPLRDLVLTLAPLGSLSIISEQLYCAAWDLLDLVTSGERPDVAPGIWNDYSIAAERLRRQAQLVSELGLVMLATSASRPARMGLAVDAWLGSRGGDLQRDAVERLGRMVTTALEEWQHAAAVASSNLLFEHGFLQSRLRRAQILAALQQRAGADLPEVVAYRCATQLLDIGCWGQEDALFNNVLRPAIDGLPEYVIVRRIQGLRLCAGYSIAAAARRLEISTYRARRLLGAFSPPSHTPEEVIGEMTKCGVLPVEANSASSAVTSIARWICEEHGGLSVFDNLTYLCPDPDEVSR